jgi:2'-5' RNA ligase
MRLFVAIDIPPNIRDALDQLLSRLRPTAKISWSPVANLHITTKFIGEWPDLRLQEIETALRAIPTRPPLRIEVGGLGWFPNPRSPRVFWVAVQAYESLGALARDTESALEPLGIARENRPFSPHLTLARIKTPTPLDSLRQTIEKLDSTGFGAFTASSFFLYRSQPAHSQHGSTGSIYTRLSEYPLKAE